MAGGLILLYGVRVTTVATLTTTDRFTRSNGAYVSLGGTPALLPPNLARPLDQLAEQPRRFGDAVAHLPHYLLPSRMATRPANPQALYALLGRHGIPAAAARNTAMLALATDLPAPVLASLVGIAPSTADDWSRLARTDWTSYLAAREHQPENDKISS